MTDLPVDEPTEADPEDLRDRNEALSLALEALSREHEASSSIARAMATAIGWETPGEWVDKAAHLAPPAAELAATRDDRRDGAGLVGGRSAAPTRDEVPCLWCGGDEIDHLLVEGDEVPEPRCLTDLLSDVLHDMETADPPAEPEWTEVVRAVHAAYRRQL